MDNKEEILTALEDFGRKPSGKVPPILQEYLRKIATTGETMFPWASVKPLFIECMDQAMTEFNSRCPTDAMAASPNVENVDFEEMRKRLIKAVNFFSGAPFTIQRLCELITNPTKHYMRTDKFLRGIEKNVLVVSTVDPFGRKVVCEPGRVILNGTEANGSTPLKDPSVSLLAKPSTDSPFVPPAPSNSPVNTSLWPDRVSSSLVESPTSTAIQSASSTDISTKVPPTSPVAMETPASTASLTSTDATALQQPVFDDDSAADSLSSARDSDNTSLDVGSLGDASGQDSDMLSSGDNVSSSSDSASSLSDISADSEAELSKLDKEAEESISERGVKDAKSASGDDTVSTSENKNDSDSPEKANSTETGQGDISDEANDIELRRVSGGFETEASSEADRDAAECDSDRDAAERDSDRDAAERDNDRDAAEADSDRDSAEADNDRDAAEADSDRDAAEADSDRDAAEADSDRDAAERDGDRDAADEPLAKRPRLSDTSDPDTSSNSCSFQASSDSHIDSSCADSCAAADSDSKSDAKSDSCEANSESMQCESATSTDVTQCADSNDDKSTSPLSHPPVLSHDQLLHDQTSHDLSHDHQTQ